MADKRISQLTERLVLAGTDVFPVVFLGATETQKAKASTLFTYIKNTLVSGIVQAMTDTDKFLVQDGTEIKYRDGDQVLMDILPNQSGNAGKVLKTDGSFATWQNETGGTMVAIPFSTDHLSANGNQYLIGDVVYYSGNIYRCIADNDSILPTNATYWVNLGSGYPLVESPIDWNSTTGNNQILNKPTIPTTPSLQQVTDIGLQTNDTIKLENGLDIYDATNLQWIELRGGDNFISLKIASALQEFFVAESSLIAIKDGVNKSGIIGINNIPASSSKTYQLPNISGSSATLVASVNGVNAGTDGNVTIPTGAGLTLQDVTDNGNTTTNDIDINNSNGLGLLDPVTSGTFRVIANGGDIQFTDGLAQFFSAGFSSISFGQINPAIFDKSLLTAPHTFNLPNNNGTLTLSVNGNTPNSLGEITIPVGGSQTLQQTTDLGNSTTNDIVMIDASVTGIDNLDFDLTPATTTHSEGRVRWNDSDKTLQIDTENSGVSISVGHDVIQRVVNKTGSTITKGRIVYIDGEQGGRPTITLADNASDLTSATTFGIVMSDIPDNQNGYVINVGLLSGINTSSFSAGQQLYLGSSGVLTGTKPVQPLHIVYVAKVISVGLLGSIFVNIQNGLELEELHDVLITTPANGEVLTYETSSGLWKNQNVPNEIPSQTGNSGKFLYTDGTSASWSFPSRHYKLGFNNIANYVINGGSGTQNLGGGTLGMSLTQDLTSMLYAISGSDYVIKCRVITAEEYGGVANQIGLRVTYSSANGVFSTDQLLIAQRIGQFGSNFGIQIANLNFNIPIQYNGANTDYFKFEVIMNRTAGGSTSVFHSELIFSV